MPTDPRGLRADAPLLDAWLRFREATPTPFTIPGHKQRTDLVGDVVAGDVPLYAGLDTMKLSTGVLAEAEARAARLWGADVCRFSTGGATHANQAVALAVADDGDEVVVSRTLHRSMLLGLVLAGLTPVWVRPEVDATTGLPLGVAPESVRRGARSPPGRPGRLRGRPVVRRDGRRRRGTGRGGARARRSAGRGRCVGGALRLPPGPPTARPAARRGRDGDQRPQDAAGLEPGRDRAGPDRAGRRRAPGGRRRGDRDDEPGRGDPRQHRRCEGAARARRRRSCSARPWRRPGRHASASATSPVSRCWTEPAVDPLKLTVVLSGSGADGNAVEQDLLALGLPVESADRDVLVAVVSLADTPDSLGALADAVIGSVERHRGPARDVVGPAAYGVEPVTVVPPRQAFFARAETVPVAGAVGRTSAELVAPYPPGIPVLAPGERVTVGTLHALEHARAAGVRIAYAADPTLATLRVTADLIRHARPG